MAIDLDKMVRGYCECALFADCGPDDETHDKEWSQALTEQSVADCAAFLVYINEQKPGLLDAIAENAAEYSDERFGHDFWLTRNGHGAGYWDREELKFGPVHGSTIEAGDALSTLAEQRGSVDLYVGDDGKVYGA